MSQEPLFWYRPRSDGGYEGPLHNGQIEDARKESGAWVPLFAGAAPVSAELDEQICRQAYGDFYHKIRAEIGPDHWCAIWRFITKRLAAPVAAQPDVTQQTLDDVMAGIPARDAEIELLRKEIETLQVQHAVTLANIEAFVACDASAISYLSLGEYRTALLKMLREGANS